jgi:predicted regulator of Ras-like GTPase activity (Roadblock/LC7/MglB family)
MTENLAGTLTELAQAVQDGRGTLLMDLDGLSVEQVTNVAESDLDSLAGEYAAPLREARAMAAQLGWGGLRRYSVRGIDRQVVFGFAPGDLILGVEAGRTGLCGQIRRAVAQALTRLGDL